MTRVCVRIYPSESSDTIQDTRQTCCTQGACNLTNKQHERMPNAIINEWQVFAFTPSSIHTLSKTHGRLFVPKGDEVRPVTARKMPNNIFHDYEVFACTPRSSRTHGSNFVPKGEVVSSANSTKDAKIQWLNAHRCPHSAGSRYRKLCLCQQISPALYHPTRTM